MERNGKGSDRSDIRREDLGAGQEMVKLKRELALIEKQILTEILAMQREPRGLRQSETTPRAIPMPEKEPALTKATKLAEAVRSVLRPPRNTAPGEKARKVASQKPPDRDRER